MNDTNEVDDLRRSVTELSARVAQLERALSFVQAVPPPPPSAALPVDNSRLGVTVINRIGAITLAIGIIFFFKYAVDENLMGAAAGVFLGIVFGLLLIGAGDWLQRKDQRIFAQGLAGLGLASLYISLYASFAFYNLIGETAGFIGLVATSAFAIALSIRFHSSVIATLGVIGALLTPILLRHPNMDELPFCGYLVLINVTAVAIATRERWAQLVSITAALTFVTAAILLERHHGAAFAIVCAILAALYFAAASRVAGGVRTSLYIVGHVAVLLAAMRFISIIAGDHSIINEADSFLLLIYGIVMLAYGLLRHTSSDRGLGLTLIGIVIAKLYCWDIWQLDRVYRISAFLALGGLLLIASWIYSRSETARGTRGG